MSIKAEFFTYLAHFAATQTLAEYRHSSGPALALRHDVDHCLDTALEVAFWEAEHGLKASYFLLHTAAYWNDPRFGDKCAQLGAFGHEVGLHTNLLPHWYHTGAAVEPRLAQFLATLRGAGLEVTGSAAHGDPLCYQRQFINYWIFSELRPPDPAARESQLNAEGIFEPDASRRIQYPAQHRLDHAGVELPLWSISMRAHGLEYEASHLDAGAYFSDSGGFWKRTADPLNCDLRKMRCQILMHPIHWRGERKFYFFLSTARSGSKWLAQIVDAATSCVGRHEFTLNHYRGADGEVVADKLTGDRLTSLLADPALVADRVAQTREFGADDTRDYAEANVYLPLVLPALQREFPDAILVHLVRNPQDVVRSIMNRGWYDTPDDPRHPQCGDDATWERASQFDKCCLYVRAIHQQLQAEIAHTLCFERMVADENYLARTLKAHGIAFYPRLAQAAFSRRVNANQQAPMPPYAQWSPALQARFDELCGDTMRELGYAFAPASLLKKLRNGAHAWLRALASRVRSVAQPQATTLATLASAHDFRRHVHGHCCSIEIAEAGLAFAAADDTRHASVLIGSTTWRRLEPGQGWLLPDHGYVSLQIDYAVATGLKARVMALLYDHNGALVHKRHLGALAPETSSRRFSFGSIGGSQSFAIAVYLPRQEAPRRGRLGKLELVARRMASAPPAPSRWRRGSA